MIIQCQNKNRFIVREQITDYNIEYYGDEEEGIKNKYYLYATNKNANDSFKTEIRIGSFDTYELAEAYLRDIAESSVGFFGWTGE